MHWKFLFVNLLLIFGGPAVPGGRPEWAPSHAEHVGAARRPGRARPALAESSELRRRCASRAASRDGRGRPRRLSRSRLRRSGPAGRRHGGHGDRGEHELHVAIATEADEELAVTAAVTAGVEGNATSAGEPAMWRETDTGVERVPECRHHQHDAVRQPARHARDPARMAVTMTEGKSAAPYPLAVASKLHVDLALRGPAPISTASRAHRARTSRRRAPT